MPTLFDMQLRALRRDRAARTGPELFLLNRAFEDCLDRVALVSRRFERALLIGCPDPAWRTQMGDLTTETDIRDPGSMFALAARGEQIVEDSWEPQRAAYDLVIAVGTLDTVNDLPRALLTIRWAMKAQGLFIGAVSGGETLPRLRSAMRAADAVAGIAFPHIHPRIESAALAPLLAQAGFRDPVIDVDRVTVNYPSLRKLVSDLRGMAATNLLTERPRRPISKRAYTAASQDFSDRLGDKTLETFEVLHFACWTAPDREPDESG